MEVVVPIEFNPSRGATLGVEWELQLIDTHTRRLRQDAREVLGAVPELSEGVRPKAMHELMQSQIEIVTDICHTAAEAVQDLSKSLTRLREVAEPRGIALACTGTHALSDWRDAEFSPMQRYFELIEEMQWLARRIQTFGVHVHVGVRERDKVIPIVNALAAYLPHFLALTTSSPFWGGQDTGLASSRAIVFWGTAHGRAAAFIGGLGGVRGVHGDPDSCRHHQEHQRGLVGHPTPSRLRHDRDPHVRRHPDPP